MRRRSRGIAAGVRLVGRMLRARQPRIRRPDHGGIGCLAKYADPGRTARAVTNVRQERTQTRSRRFRRITHSPYGFVSSWISLHSQNAPATLTRSTPGRPCCLPRTYASATASAIGQARSRRRSEFVDTSSPFDAGPQRKGAASAARAPCRHSATANIHIAERTRERVPTCPDPRRPSGRGGAHLRRKCTARRVSARTHRQPPRRRWRA